MQLAPPRQPVKQNPIERRPKGKEQGDQRQAGEEEQMYIGDCGVSAVASKIQKCYARQHPRRNPQVIAAFDIVFDAPEEGVNRFAQGIGGDGLPLAVPNIKPVMVTGIAKNIG